MLERPSSGSSLKINVYSFILILLYAIYAFLGVNPLRINASIPNLESPNYPNFVMILVAIIIIAVMLYGIIKAKWSSIKCGFNIDRPFWIIFAIFVILMIMFVVEVPQTISFRIFLELIPIFLFITGSEIILRVLLINSILNSISNNEWARVAAISLSGILFAVVHSPMEEITFSRTGLDLFLLSLPLSWIYIKYGSLAVIVFIDMILYAKTDYAMVMAIIVLAFYFPIVFIGRYFEKKPITTAGMG
ncbi:MAG: hypothetical protein CVT49_07225 [candidate division Zixibacteria bacterium HGW-Zixibacteria-1]|nr:MAG: hypothetical protein CVT49_07225 [candidate division Zixibacteria bacterium HGW-Zixibacteria-1]